MAHLVRNGGLDALKSDPFVDFTVKCADREWKVHRTTLCGDSPVLVLHCTQMMEAEKRELDLHEADPKAVECLLTYQYLGFYEDVDWRASKQPSVSDPEPEDSRPYLPRFPDYPLATEVPTWCPSPPPSVPSRWKCRDLNPQIPAMDTMDRATITSILVLSVNVFELAQRFGLPDLEEYAIQKLMEKEQYFPCSDLDKVLSLVFDVTAHDDTKLRYPLFLRCVENYTIVQSFPKALEQLDLNVFEAWRYAQKAQQDLVDKDKEMRRQKSTHKAEMRMQEKASSREARELRSSVRSQQARINDLEGDIRDLDRKLEKSKKEAKRLRSRFNFWAHA